MMDNDWHSMDRRQIDRMIANVLGYSVYHYDKDVEPRCYYQLWDENGDPAAFKTYHGLEWGERKTESEAWDDMPKWSWLDEHAMQLTEYSDDFTLQKKDGLWIAQFTPQMLFTGDIGFKSHDMALCIAVNFLNWAVSGSYKKKAVIHDD